MAGSAGVRDPGRSGGRMTTPAQGASAPLWGVSSTSTQKASQQWHGVYLGKVTQTRYNDLWVQVAVPQVLGRTSTAWARPMGFSGLVYDPGDIDPGTAGTSLTPTAAATTPAVTGKLDPTTLTTSQSQVQGAATSSNTVKENDLKEIGWLLQQHNALSNGPEVGPGPPVNSFVLVMFLAGDVTKPVY